MAKKGGNKKKSAARNNKKKLNTTTASSNESSSPPSPTVAVNSTVNSSTESLPKNNASSTSLAHPVEIAQQLVADDKALDIAVAAAVAVTADQEDNKDNRVIDTTKIPSECSFENVVDQLEIATDVVHIQKKETLEEPPHIEAKAEPIVVTLDTAPLSNDTTEPVEEIILEKTILPEVIPDEKRKHINEIESTAAQTEVVISFERATTVEEPKPIVTLVEEAKSEVNIKPTGEADDVQEINLIDESKTVEVKSTQQATIAEIQSIEEIKPVEKAKSVEIAKETKFIAETRPLDLVQPVEKIKSDYEVKPVQDIKSPQQTHEAEVAETKDGEKVESQENNNDIVAQEEPNVVLTSALNQVYNTIIIEEPSITVTEVTPAQSGVESSAPEDTRTLGSQSILTEALSATTEQSTIEEERYQEIAKPAIVQELIKDVSKKSFIKKSKNMMGKTNTLQKDTNVTKRKSQILSLFKRGGEKEKSNMAVSPKSESPYKPDEKKQTRPETKKSHSEKKVKQRKSWMFWKPSAPVQQQ